MLLFATAHDHLSRRHPHAKPHPAPLLEATRQLGVCPTARVYVGDDRRDVQAGAAAGMVTVAVSYGYVGD